MDHERLPHGRHSIQSVVITLASGRRVVICSEQLEEAVRNQHEAQGLNDIVIPYREAYVQVADNNSRPHRIRERASWTEIDIRVCTPERPYEQAPSS